MLSAASMGLCDMGKRALSDRRRDMLEIDGVFGLPKEDGVLDVSEVDWAPGLPKEAWQAAERAANSAVSLETAV